MPCGSTRSCWRDCRRRITRSVSRPTSRWPAVSKPTWRAPPRRSVRRPLRASNSASLATTPGPAPNTSGRARSCGDHFDRGTPFGLYLRNVDLEAHEERLDDGMPFVGLANGVNFRKDFAPAIPKLEVSHPWWQTVLEILVRNATRIVFDDRHPSPGVATELELIASLGRAADDDDRRRRRAGPRRRAHRVADVRADRAGPCEYPIGNVGSRTPASVLPSFRW